MIKSLAERFKPVWKGILTKFFFFNMAITALFFTMGALMTATLPKIFEGKLWLIYLAGNIVFFIYDFGLTKLILLYLVRVDRVVRKNGR